LNSNNFINSSAVGYLEKKSDSWFRNWTEKFCVLTNVGLLYYDDPQKRPNNLFPTIDAKIIPVNEATYNRKYVFQLKSLSIDLTLAARKQEDYNMWTKALEQSDQRH
jgi:hypothetical protein